MIDYNLPSIDSNILSVLDVVDAGKVVTAEAWVQLWELVINRVNKLNDFCINIADIYQEIADTNAKLKETETNLTNKYNALKDSFMHYGSSAPTNNDIALWIQPVENPNNSQLATLADIAKKANIYRGTESYGASVGLIPSMSGVGSITSNDPLADMQAGDFYVNTESPELYYCTFRSDSGYRNLVRLYPTISATLTTITLNQNAWVEAPGGGSPYSQTLCIPGVTSNSKVDLNPTIDQLNVFYNKDISFVVENNPALGEGCVTIYCIGQKPTMSYTMQATITEVYVK